MLEEEDFPLEEGQEEAEDWAEANLDDDFAHLREVSARSSELFDDMEMTETASGGNFFTQFTAAQRLILLVLFFMNLLVASCILLFVVGVL